MLTETRFLATLTRAEDGSTETRVVCVAHTDREPVEDVQLAAQSMWSTCFSGEGHAMDKYTYEIISGFYFE